MALCGTSPLEAQNRWIDFFRVMEGGQRISWTQYRQHWRQGLAMFMNDTQEMPAIQALPSLFDLEAAFRRVASRKGDRARQYST